jgi:hypothetical protein
VINIPVTSGERTQARLLIVRYNPRVLPIVVGLPKCSIKISRHSIMRVFVARIDTNANDIKIGFCEPMRNTKPSILIHKRIIESLRLPKFFKKLVFRANNRSVITEAVVYNSPTYFSEIICVRNVEFTYAESAMCKVNKNDKMYILCIFENSIFLLYTQKHWYY